MNSSSRLASQSASRLEFARHGLASIVFSILGPGDAKSATVQGYALTLRFLWRSVSLPVKDIEKVTVSKRWRWSVLRVGFPTRNLTLSGLSPNDASTLTDALEASRVRWWKTALATSGDTLRPVNARLEQLADPPAFTTRKALAHLQRETTTVASRFPSAWPETLSRHAQVRVLARLRRF